MAHGKILMNMDEKCVKYVIGAKIIVYYDCGYIGECILYNSARIALCNYLTPVYRKGKNLDTKALNAAKTILLNLISGYELNKDIPIEILNTTK